MMIRNLFLGFACLSILMVTGCQVDDSPSTSTAPKKEAQQEQKAPEKKKETQAVEDYKFELNDTNIKALKKGEIRGFPVQLGEDENKVKATLGEPKKRKDDGHGEVLLTYPNFELSFTYYKGEAQDQKKLDIPVLRGVIFPIDMTQTEIEKVMGKPTDQRALQPNSPELEYDFDPYMVLFLTSKESKVFEGPYDEFYFVDPRP